MIIYQIGSIPYQCIDYKLLSKYILILYCLYKYYKYVMNDDRSLLIKQLFYIFVYLNFFLCYCYKETQIIRVQINELLK